MDEKKILVMDDDVTQLTAIQEILQQNFSDVVVDVCVSPQEATDLLKKNRYVLFLLDIEIEGSGVTGIHLAEKIRQVPLYLNTPIIFVSSHRHLRGRVLQRVCSYDFLVKPYDPKELVSSVGEALGIKEYLKQKFEQSQTLQIKVGSVTCRYNVNEIACIQMLKGVLTISGRVEEVRAERGAFDDILEQLEVKKIDRLRRIHRAVLVNIDQIKKTEDVGRESQLWLFNCSQPLPVSRGFRDNIKEVL